MAIVVTFNGGGISSGAFCQGVDQPIAGGEASDDVVLSSGPAITVTAITISSWSKRIKFVHGQTLPFVLSGGTPLNCTIQSINPELLIGHPPLVGCPNGRVTISYTDGTGDHTFMFEYAVRMVDATLDENDFPSLANYLNLWIYDIYSFASNSLNVPLGLSWGLENPAGGGHLIWAMTYLPTAIAQGLKHVVMFLPGGALERVDDDPEDDFIFDWWLIAQEYGAASGNPQIYNSFEASLDWIISQGVTPWIYNGTLRQSSRFLALRSTPDEFIQRILTSINWGLRRHMGFMFDAPASNTAPSLMNPHIEAGEQRYESLNWIRKLKARQGLATYIEPRTPATDTDWFGVNGWSRVALEPGLDRSNPDWYSDTGGTTSDAQMSPGPIASLIVDGSNSLLPFQLAELYQRGYQAISSISFFWVTVGGFTLTDLYNQTKTHLRAIRGA